MTEHRPTTVPFAPFAALALALAVGCGPVPHAGPSGAVELAGPLPADPHQDGAASALRLVELRVGRLVDVFALDPSGGPREAVLSDLVIGEAIASDGVDFLLGSAHGTQREELTILHPAGSAAFDAALERAHEARGALPIQALDANALPPFGVVPRNAALELRFDDLVDPLTLDADALGIAVGAPPEEAFEARLLVDPNHGVAVDVDGDGVAEQASTRVIVDLSISSLEAALSDPPLAPNAAGLPAAASAGVQNLALALATRAQPEVGAPGRLANLAGSTLASEGALFDPQHGALVLGLRSGGDSDTTGDLNLGFLTDTVPPTVVGEIAVQLSGAVPSGPAMGQAVTIPRVDFASPTCTTVPKAGDLVEAAGFVGEVTAYGALDATGVDKLELRVLVPGAGLPVPGPALLVTAFDPVLDDPRCFVRFAPAPSAPPVDGVSPQAEVRLRFSEAMDVESMRPFDSFRVKQVPGVPSAFQLVVGTIVPQPELVSFAFASTLGFSHRAGQAEAYYVELASGPNGPTDLAGNPLAAALPVVPFSLDPAAPTAESGGVVFRFHKVDELYGDAFPELRGQFLYDLAQQEVRPRQLVHYSVSADRDKPVPGAMIPFPPGLQTPLVPFGSKLHAVWRYVDFGFSVLDETNHNVDVEGLAWAPLGGAVVSDAFAEFQIGLGTSQQLPDEFINPMSGFPAYPDSGVGTTYAQNFLAPEPDGGEVVHPRSSGYAINPADQFVGVSGTTLMPFPLNQGIPVSEYRYYTWRDTSLQSVAGLFGAGVPQAQEVAILGLSPSQIGAAYPVGQVPSIGLPLLMEFRCHPDPTALGLNAFDISISANSSPQPNHRVYSSGGFNTSGQAVLVDPDNQPVASGGFNPSSSPPGQQTAPDDNVFYVGQVDLVTRVSRAHTVWLPTQLAAANFAQALVELGGAVPGTEVSLAFRGAVQILGLDGSPVPDDITTNAGTLDPYGDPVAQNGTGNAPGEPVFLNGDATWHDDVSAIDGSSWFQARVTFVGDAATNQTAALSSLGFAFAP